MKRQLIFFLVILLAFIPLFGVSAGKPKPTPYPSPYEEFSNPYPPPEESPSTLNQLYSKAPSADPIPGTPYGWGLFPLVRSDGKVMFAWWVTIQGVGNIGWANDGSVCVSVSGVPGIDCKLLMFWEYNSRDDLNVFYGPFNPKCDVWSHFSSIYLYGSYGNWREPNNYFYHCIYVPKVGTY